MKSFITPDGLHAANLTAQNKHSMLVLFASTKQANMLNIKGASKSAITALIHGAVAANKNIKVLTPNHYHVADIKANTKQPIRQSENLFSWIKNAFLFQEDQNYVDTLGGFTFKQDRENTLSNRDIIVVDQAEKLLIHDAHKLLEITQAGKAKLIYLNRDGAKDNKKTTGNIIETLKFGGIESFDFAYQKTANAALNIQEIKDEKAQIQAVVNAYQGLSADDQSKTLVVAYTKKEVATLNQGLRDAMKREQPNTPCLTLNMAARVFMTPEQACVAKSYSKGDRVEFFTKNSGVLSYKITGIDTANNRVKTEALQSSVIDQLLGKSPKETSFNPLENKTPVSLLSTEPFEVMKGEKLMVLNTRIAALNKGTSYQVHNFDNKNVQLLDSNGEIITVSQADFEKSNVQYDYARTLDYVSDNEDKNLIAVFKQYRLDKEVTAELVTKAKDSIELFTDDIEKAKNRMGQSGVQPSVITTTIKAHFTQTESITKYVSDKTKTLLTTDLTQALTALHIEANKKALVKSVEHAINVLSDRQAAFEHVKLVEIAAEHCINEYKEVMDYAAVKLELDALLSKGKIMASGDNLLWTTQEAIALESEILKSCADGKGVVKPLASVKDTNVYLENHQANNPKHRQLTEGQIAAIKLISNTKDRFVAIQGYAGTGKSTMLQQAQNIVKHVEDIQKDTATKMEFIGFASTHTAVKALSQKNIRSQTLQSLLFENAKETLNNKAPGDFSNKVFLLDEASMVSNKDCNDFMHLIANSGARAVLVGDITQAESLGAGAPTKMLILGDKIEVALMKDIKRQQDSHYLAAVKAVTRHKPDVAYQLLAGQQSHHAIGYRAGQAPPPELRISIVESEASKLETKEETNPEQLAFIKTFNDLVDGKQPAKSDPNRDKAIGLLRKIKVQEIQVNMAAELGARTEACRNKTLTILDAHTDREALTSSVRLEDKINQLISPHEDNNITIARLKNKNLTPHQMHDISYYESNMVLQKGANHYHEIMGVDRQNSVLKIRDLATNKISHFAPLRANHHFNGLFEVKKNEVALREQLIMTKTDKTKGIFAKDKMRVIGIDQDKGFVTLVNQEKKNHVVLDKNNLATLHWDYALTTTTHSSQGTDKPFAVVAHKSTSPLASIRSMYVGLSRGQRHIRVFTDDRKAFLKKIKTEFKDNTIAVNKVTGEVTLSEYFDRYKAEKPAARSEASNAAKTSRDKGFPQTSQTYNQYIPADNNHVDLEGFDEYLASQRSLSAPEVNKVTSNQKTVRVPA